MGYERIRQKDQRKKMVFNTRGCIQWRQCLIHPLMTIFYVNFKPALTIHMGHCHQRNLTLSSSFPTLQGDIILQPH